MFEFHFCTQLRHLFFHFVFAVTSMEEYILKLVKSQHAIDLRQERQQNDICREIRKISRLKIAWGLGNIRHVNQAKSRCNFYLFSKIDNKWMFRSSYIC